MIEDLSGSLPLAAVMLRLYRPKLGFCELSRALHTPQKHPHFCNKIYSVLLLGGIATVQHRQRQQQWFVGSQVAVNFPPQHPLAVL